MTNYNNNNNNNNNNNIDNYDDNNNYIDNENDNNNTKNINKTKIKQKQKNEKINSLYINYNNILPNNILKNLLLFINYKNNEKYKVDFNLFLLNDIIKINEDNELLKSNNCLENIDEFIDYYFDKIDDKLDNNNLNKNNQSYLINILKQNYIKNKKNLEIIDKSINKLVKLKKQISLSNIINNKLDFQFLNDSLYLENDLKDDIGECIAHFLFLYLENNKKNNILNNITNSKLSEPFYRNNLFKSDNTITPFNDIYNIVKYFIIYYLIIENFASKNKNWDILFEQNKLVEFIKKNVIIKKKDDSNKKKKKKKKKGMLGGGYISSKKLKNLSYNILNTKYKNKDSDKNKYSDKNKNSDKNNIIIKKFEKINIIITEKGKNNILIKKNISINQFLNNNYNNTTFDENIKIIIEKNLKDMSSISLNSYIQNPFNEADKFEIDKILKKLSEHDKKGFHDKPNNDDKIKFIKDKIDFKIFNYLQICNLLLNRENQFIIKKFLESIKKNIVDIYLCIYIKKRELINLFLNSILFRFNNINNTSLNNLVNLKKNNDKNDKNNKNDKNDKKINLIIENKLQEYKINNSIKKKKVKFLLGKLYELEKEKGNINYDKKIQLIHKKIRSILLNIN